MRLTLPGSWMFVAAAALCACAGNLADHSNDSAQQTPDSDDTGAPPEDTDTGPPSSDTPTWWALDGSIALQGQQAAAPEALFVVELRGRDLSTLCSTERVAAALTPVDPQIGPLYAAWQVTLADGVGCEPPVPQQFLLGVGPYDPQLDPAAAQHDLDGSTLYGLYVQPEGRPLYVFGVAGTAEHFAGDALATAPLPDGTYTLDGLHLLPL